MGVISGTFSTSCSGRLPSPWEENLGTRLCTSTIFYENPTLLIVYRVTIQSWFAAIFWTDFVSLFRDVSPYPATLPFVAISHLRWDDCATSNTQLSIILATRITRRPRIDKSHDVALSQDAAFTTVSYTLVRRILGGGCRFDFEKDRPLNTSYRRHEQEM